MNNFLENVRGFTRGISDDIKKGENLDVYTAIVVALTMTLVSAFGLGSYEILSASAFATLTVLLFATISERRRIDSLLSALNSILPKNQLLSVLAPFDQKDRTLIQNASRVSVLGTSLFRFLPGYQTELCEMLIQGGSLRVILGKPTETVARESTMRSTTGVPETIQIKRITAMIDLLVHWQATMPNAQIELRLIDAVAPFALTWIEPRVDNSRPYCLVRLPTFKTPTSAAPAITPDPIDDAYWFDFFTDQFQNIWDAAEVYEVK